MKISEVAVQHVTDFIRIAEENGQEIAAIMAAGRSFIRSYTGLTDEAADGYEDLAFAFLVLCAEMYDNRAFTVQEDRLNPFVKAVLDMHAINYL